MAVGIWIYDHRRQERLKWEARVRNAVDQAIAQMVARQTTLTPPISPPPAPPEAAAPVSAKPTKPPPPLKPATPDSCPYCRAQAVVESLSPPQPATPVNPQADPWADSVVTVRRGPGRPKTVNTHGFACPNPECNFYNHPDAANMYASKICSAPPAITNSVFVATPHSFVCTRPLRMQ